MGVVVCANASPPTPALPTRGREQEEVTQGGRRGNAIHAILAHIFGAALTTASVSAGVPFVPLPPLRNALWR